VLSQCQSAQPLVLVCGSLLRLLGAEHALVHALCPTCVAQSRLDAPGAVKAGQLMLAGGRVLCLTTRNGLPPVVLVLCCSTGYLSCCQQLPSLAPAFLCVLLVLF
jgi:hypothetical protein